MPAEPGITTLSHKIVDCTLLCAILLLASAPSVMAETGLINRVQTEKSGMINRTPLIHPEPEPNNLERIKNNIDDLVRSINKIIDTPMDTTTTIVLPEKSIKPIARPLPLLAKPQVENPATGTNKAQATMPAAVTRETETVSVSQEITAQPVKQANDLPNTDLEYVKHDISGNQLQADVSEWTCVEDTRNGLLWEVKSSNGDIRDRNNSYTWFNPSDKNQQGIADGGHCEGDISCDTHAYITAINQQKLCGYTDWRLPTREEMLSLIDFDQNSVAAKINLQYFPQALPSWYWTASSDENHPQYAWYVLFRNGVSLNDLKERPKHIRLVRGDRNA